MASITSKASKDINAILALLFIGALLSIPFGLHPRSDIHYSLRVFSPDVGFIYANHPVVLFIYKAVPVIAALVIISCFVMLAAYALKRFVPSIPPILVPKTYLAPLFVLLALILGPGAAVHYVAKEFFERPRPREIIEFGGNKKYVAAFHRGTQEGKSFVSGHASVGFFLAALALVVRRRSHAIALYTGGILLGLIIGAGRIMQGGHFVSDVLFAGILILIINHALHWLLFQKQP
ncbi:MAG: phosphatase PAP2 family protein [Proteobacteria bacterium]|nr:phosphatase PAP2 family protein [Pseudomonadota bacterium]